MSEKRTQLTPKQELAIVSLLSEPTIGKAANRAGVAERTLYRWLEDAAFADAYRAARHETVTQTMSRMQQASGHAVTVLLSLMADKSIAPGTRLRAAIACIEFTVKMTEIEQIEQRLAALEAAAKETP